VITAMKMPADKSTATAERILTAGSHAARRHLLAMTAVRAASNAESAVKYTSGKRGSVC
jgi:hypothetical protein